MVTSHQSWHIVIKTFDDAKPETVKTDYCREGFYDNTIFHRVINGLAIHRAAVLNPHETKKRLKFRFRTKRTTV